MPSGLCSALLEESFACDGPTGEWEFTVLEGVITWAVDGEPDPPGAYGEGCSLNFNDNGNDYDSPGGAPSFGQAISPIVDSSALPEEARSICLFTTTGKRKTSQDQTGTDVVLRFPQMGLKQARVRRRPQ